MIINRRDRWCSPRNATSGGCRSPTFRIRHQSRGRMKIGKHFNPKDAASRRNLAAALRARLSEIDLDAKRGRQTGVDPETQAHIEQRRAALRHHPCHTLPRTRGPCARGPSARCGWSGKAPGCKPG